VKVIFGRRKHTHSNKRIQSDVSERTVFTKTEAYMHMGIRIDTARRPIALAPMNMSVFKTRFLAKPRITSFFAVVRPPCFYTPWLYMLNNSSCSQFYSNVLKLILPKQKNAVRYTKCL